MSTLNNGKAENGKSAMDNKKIVPSNQPPKKKIDDTIRTIELDGVKSLFESTTFCGRMFWVTLLMVSISILIYQLYKTISDYIDSPVISTFTIKTADSLDFPILYLCPASIVSQQFLNSSSNAERQTLALRNEMSKIWDYTDYLATGNLSEPFEPIDEDGSAARADVSHLNPQEFFRQAAMPLTSHLKHCEFRTFQLQPLDCASVTREVLDPDHGKCYVLDVGALRQTVPSQGLQFVFNVQSRSYPTSEKLAPTFNGLYVSVEKEFNPTVVDAILLTPNTFNRIDLATQHQIFMNLDDQPCVKVNTADDDDKDDSDDKNDDAPTVDFETFNVNYTQGSCKYDCVARQLASVCKCLPPIDSSLYKPQVFNKTDGFCREHHINCIKEKVQGDPKVADQIDKCRKRCQVPCRDWRYNVRTTNMNLYKGGFNETEPVEDTIYVTVAFSHMEFSKYTQSRSMQIDDVIANLGGQIGLWLGGSMMTLVQIPLFLFSYCGVTFFHKAKAAKRRQVVAEQTNKY